MVIIRTKCPADIARGDPVCQNIMNGLYMERLLYLGVWRNDQMEENEGGHCGEEQHVDWRQVNWLVFLFS